MLGLQPEAEGLLTAVCHRVAPSHLLALEDHFGGGSVEGGAEQDKAEGQGEQLGGWEDHPGER